MSQKREQRLGRRRNHTIGGPANKRVRDDTATMSSSAYNSGQKVRPRRRIRRLVRAVGVRADQRRKRPQPGQAGGASISMITSITRFACALSKV